MIPSFEMHYFSVCFLIQSNRRTCTL
uniref:Uncharacterized protein n=1 Tax=Nelumbo nucifera TaxID=4432 RepID=A0A822YUU4_NELNU|nr:TPA_asm: hypothetical protein HUJ06_006920 [Nelumbo nucifera]